MVFVEDEEVLFVEILDYILENTVLDCAVGTFDDHQARFVAILGRVLGQHVGGELIPVLR